MQRGMLSITKPEIKSAWQAINNSRVDTDLLINKLQAAWQDPNLETQIEISCEDAEIILDNLPTPAAGDELANGLREKLNQFLS